jgi:hypothetical protein
VAFQPEVYSNEAFLKGRCAHLLSVTLLGNNGGGESGLFDTENLHCALYHTANYTSNVIAITGITDDRLKRAFK